MITILSKIFILDAKEYQKTEVRRQYSMLCSALGVVLNLFLFAIKLAAGFITSSMAILADAFNNLSDAGSSVVAFAGSICAGKQSDKEHPFGHGRIEYIAGFIISVMIIMLGIELLRNSVEKILHPVRTEADMTAVGILIISVLLKVYMMCYNYKVGKKIHSPMLKATALDSLGDVVSTTVVILSVCLSDTLGKNTDGFAGFFVSLFILFSGIQSAKETMDPLLGKKPEPEFIERIHDIVMTHEDVVGIHNIIVHDYGPAHRMISLHLEMPGDKNVFEMHDLVEHIEADLDSELCCESVIHMDPVEVHDEKILQMKKDVSAVVKEIDENLTIHDFRELSIKEEKNRLIFDVVMPQEFFLTAGQLEKETVRRIEEKYPEYICVVKIDRDYI